MTPYELDISLPDIGDAHVVFSATYSHFNRAWELDPSITITLVDDEDDEELALTDLDKSSQMIVQAEIQGALDADEPTERESKFHIEDARGDYEYDCWRDAQLLAESLP